MTLPTIETTGRRPATWEVGRRFLLRAAGLPVESVHGLRCPRTRAWADEVLAREERLAAEGAALSDTLHGLLGAADALGDEARRALLALRRRLFNNRPPADPGAAVRLVTGLDGAAGGRVAGWLDDRERFGALLAEGPALLADELGAARGALRAVLSREEIRRGLLLASPTLDGRLDAYLNGGTGTAEGTGADTSTGTGTGTGKASGSASQGRMRKIERSALTYLYRTACKTSPFSTFTPVASAVFDAEAAADTGSGVEGTGPHLGSERTGHVRLNVVALGRIADLILADPVLRQDLPVVLSPGWGRDEDRIRYVRQWVTSGDDDASVTFDSVRDRLFYLRGSGTLERLLAFLDGSPGLRHRDLVERLATEHGAEPAECERYAAALIKVGMVQVPCLRTDVHSADPLESFREALRDLSAPWADAVAESLGVAAACLAAYPAARLGERRALLRTLREQLLDVQRSLGAEEPTLPRTLLYEDVSAGDGLVADAGLLPGGAAAALRAVEGVLPMFDLTLPHRICLQGFFLARYGRGGRCDDLLGLVHDFHEDFFDQYVSFTAKRSAFDASGAYVPEENWLGQSALRTLDDARRRFVSGMRELWEKQGTDEELSLPADLLDSLADELDPLNADFTPQSHHLQVVRPASGGGAGRVVLNRSYGGLAFPFSRFTHVYDGPEASGLSAELRAELRDRQPSGAVFAELTGGPVTSNLNLHGRLTDHQIVCPGETSTVPEEARLHLDDLYLEHDETADRLVLRSKRLGREVVPVYLGYLVPVALPEIPRTLLLLSPSSMTPTDVWGGVPEGPAVDGVTRRPRVVHGEVVVSRRSWTADASVLPVRAPGTDEAAWYLGWRRWQRAHGLPDRVFATVLREGRRALGAKPVYLDFDSPLSLTAFEALVDRAPGSGVALREMLPAEDALHLTSDEGRHVAELAVETFTFRHRTEDGPTCRN
ncbi:MULTISPECIES: lantibiotic dehydratase [unclassified Streptomyces]|uniref:lantibiotic dehydratase n=1 Tax=unclassified Streptomyces TaxID=2593676 RepID=UPI0016607E48|nr:MULTISPECIES: lantibiotic dehydratase [unclassified Streptomyces]MBD0708870.1 lantibiotic dehydratase [Streptomyces sp. CBMA291]MBD0714991.1 lantibiotic dehydratase [Streptomyces sp. CBMA370]